MAPYTEADSNQPKNLILFNQTKREVCSLSNDFKSWQRKLRNNWKVMAHDDEITEDSLRQARVFVLPGCREKFTTVEMNHIKNYLHNGGSVLVMMGEGGEKNYNTNLNYLLEQYGVFVNNDAVVRSVYYKYFHPKEALVSNGVLNRAISQAAGKYIPGVDGKQEMNSMSQALQFVYPFGATLNVVKPSIAVLSSGSACIPVNRPIMAMHKAKQGKLGVMGSVHMFSDQYIDKEENSKVMEVLMQWLTTDEIELNVIDADDPEISDYNTLPHTELMADSVKSCLQETDDISSDFTKMFGSRMFKMDTLMYPKILKGFEDLKIKAEPLTLISPNFDTPLPTLQPAVFPPEFKDIPAPSLDLFDLDECFSSEKVRLAQITNKCNDDDLEYYIRECGDILGVTKKLAHGERDAKHILAYVFANIVEYKKLNRDAADME